MSKDAGFDGATVLSFESRRSEEMGRLIEAHGGRPVVAPSMREVPLSESQAAPDLVEKLRDGRVDVVVLLTGVGTRSLVEACEDRFSPEEVAAALSRASLVARGPKPVSALKELDLAPDVVAPDPHTWREVVEAAKDQLDLDGLRVAVQEYGVSNPDLTDALEQEGAEVERVPVYRWALPEDLGPLRDAIDLLLDGGADVVVFTTATQADHLFRVAREDGVESNLRAAFEDPLVASVGPVTTRGLGTFGIDVDVEASPPKMGHLVAEAARAL